jgi:dynein heavy chain
MIFSKIVKAFISDFSESIAAVMDGIVESTQNIFNGVASNLRPTPSKSHYTFNLRDISKIFQGVCAADKKEVVAPENLFRLWIHENDRVFGDRMINN